MRALSFALFLLLIWRTNGNAQQISPWSSYYENGFIHNPALTARWNTWELSSTYKREWTGFQGGPEIGTLGFQYPFIRRFTKMTMGAYATYDKVGPYGTYNYALTYAYKIRTRWFGKRDDVLSFGIKGGALRYQFDPTSLLPFEKPEGEFKNIPNSLGTLPDISGGVFYNSVSDFYSFKSHYYFGLAVSNLLPLNTTVYANSIIKNVPHLFAHGGYRYYPWRAKYYFEPSVFVSYSYQRAMQAMASCRFELSNKFWLSSGLVTSGDMFAQAGVIFDKKSVLGPIVNDGILRMGVKADYTVSSLRRHTGMGYEFYIAYLYSNEPY